MLPKGSQSGLSLRRVSTATTTINQSYLVRLLISIMESGFALLELALLLPLTVILLVLTGLAAPSARHVNEALIVRAGVTTLIQDTSWMKKIL